MSRLHACKLNSSQIVILKALARSSKPLTRVEIEEKAKTSASVENLGPSYKELLEKYPESLYGLGFVRPEGVLGEDGREVISWQLTERGEHAAIEYKAVRFVGSKIPSKVLDPVVRKMKKTRAYGFESYTVSDLKEILAGCGEQYKDTPLNDLRQQITNRRKVGAYAEKVSPETIWPEWYQEYRKGKHFQELEATFDKRDGCILNPAHVENVILVHRETSNIGFEKRGDMVLMCLECWKRNYKVFPQIFGEIPGSDLGLVS